MSTDDEDGPDDGPDNGTDEGTSDGGTSIGDAAAGATGEGGRRKRRRRRRNRDGAPREGGAPGADASAAAPAQGDGSGGGGESQPADGSQQVDGSQRGGGERQRRDWNARRGDAPRGGGSSSGAPTPSSSGGETEATADHSTAHAGDRDTLANPDAAPGSVPTGQPPEQRRERHRRGQGPRDGGGRDQQRTDGNRAGGDQPRTDGTGSAPDQQRGGRDQQRGGGNAPQQQRGGGRDQQQQRGAGRDQQRGAGNAPQQQRGGGRDQQQQRGAGRDQERGGGQQRGGGRDQQRGGGADRARNEGDEPFFSDDAGSTAPRADGAGLVGDPYADGATDQRTDGTNANANDQRDGSGQRNDNRAGRDQQRGGRGDGAARGDQRARDGGARGGRDGGARDGAPERQRQEFAPPAAASGQRRGGVSHDDDDEKPAEASGANWGVDDDGPVPDIQLKSDFPPDAGLDDLDATTFPMFATGPTGTPPQQAGGDVAGVVGVRFVAAGRIQWADAGDAEYSVGERVIVDSERGPRLATIATPPTRKTTRERGVRRVIRRANESDLRGERDSDTEIAKALRIAKDAASGAKLPIKVYRVELAGGGGPTGGPSSGLRGAKLNVYYTCDERVDVRGFLATVGRETGARIELRQLGVRDEAKAVGGIGSCGLTLCCTTWLPDFVPVSIKMAKDQGLVLSPTKVAGQCGRLKCCLVYEQAGYAELRKGLPKLGKRVISERGEGRVVEVDVLRQRLRVSYGMGDSEVLPATSVKPLFPPGGGPGGGGDDERGPRGERAPRGERGGRDDRGRGERRDDRRADGPAAPGAPTGPSEAEHEDIDPAKLAGELYADLDDDEDAGPTDDPSSMHHVANEPDEPDVPDNGLASDNPSSQHVSADDTDDE